jgi:hypothetical protein
MASGIGAFGGTGQCYRFWLGFSECRVSGKRMQGCATFLTRMAVTRARRQRRRCGGTGGSSRRRRASHAPRTGAPPRSHRRALPAAPLPQLHTPNPALCVLEQADFLECLHRDKLKRRIATKLMEAKRVHAEAHGGGGGGHGDGHH